MITINRAVVEQAREAGFVAASFCRWSAYTDDLARFAALVRADEREACAKVCDERITHEPGMQREDYENRQCAAAIRARGS